jgi:hypothetical protein
MSSTTAHCDRIITLIDACLADYEDSRRPRRRSPDTVASAPMFAPDASWWRLVPTATPLRDRHLPTAA